MAASAQLFDLKRYLDDQPAFDPKGVRFDAKNDVLVIDDEDGGVILEFNPRNHNSKAASEDHEANLAEFMDEGDLMALAVDLIEGVEEDRRSFAQWLQDRANGVKLLGFKLEEPRSDLASSSAPLEGMSTVRHPLLGEACLHFQANARREFIPSDGPTKVAVYGAQTAGKDWLAEKLEKEMNWYLTKKATEFVPGTDRLLFMVGFSGMAFKKVYFCPMRRRPVSEMVDAEHLVVSNTTTDIQTAQRVTQIVSMQQTVFKRLQLLGVYRDVSVQLPDANINAFDAAVARSQGVNLNVTRPEDQVHTIYECYTDVDLPGFEHYRDGEYTGLPLPYRVTIDLTSRTVLEIRRDWKAGDEDFIRRRTFVPFGFAPTFGFYCTGLLQILGNTTSAVTGAWRLMLDTGMFNNFPGFLYAQNGAKQENNTFRVPPGGGAPVNVPGGMKLSDSIMALPYKEPSATLMALVDNIANAGQKLAGTAELPTSEGKADVPVGTMLAAIEQAGKILNAVHTRLHDAQTIELELILEHLRQHPEVLYRPDPDQPEWTLEAVQHAMANYNLVPRSDPNTPSHAHRLMKAVALGTVAQQTPLGVFDPKKVATRVLQMMQIDDVDSLFAGPNPNPQPSPEELKAKTQQEGNQLKFAAAQQQNQIKLQEIQARQQVEMAKLDSHKQLEYLRLLQHLVTHPLSSAIFGGEQGPGDTEGFPPGFQMPQ